MPPGIGLLIAAIGLQWAGLIVASPGTLVTLGSLHSPPVLLALVALLLTSILMARRVPGAFLWGILASTAVGWPLGLVQFHGIVGAPPSIRPTLGQLDIAGAFAPGMAAVIFVFFFLALFDSVGTLVGVGQQAGLLRNGTLPRAREALLADAIGTVAGAALGTSTVTAYIESGAGIASGGRTGLASLVTAALFLLSLFFYPLVQMVGGGYTSGTTTLYPVIAPPLILVGTMMIGGLRHVAWDDPTEAIPAFLTLVIMPLAVSITEGVAFGVVSYAVLKLGTGRGRDAHPLIYVFAALFLARYAFLPSGDSARQMLLLRVLSPQRAAPGSGVSRSWNRNTRTRSSRSAEKSSAAAASSRCRRRWRTTPARATWRTRPAATTKSTSSSN